MTSKFHLLAKNSYKRSTSLVVGGSESGTTFLSFNKFEFEDGFTTVSKEDPGTVILHTVCICFTEPRNDIVVVLLLPLNLQYLLAGWTTSVLLQKGKHGKL